MPPTHDVLNQPPALAGYDVADDPVMLDALRREGADWAEEAVWWARRRYPRRPRRVARAERRFGSSYAARWNRLRDLVAGAPDR
jgi:DMSO/TMAO reductase YedYZ molybdopterin-dependent catalytic subunit